MATRAGGRGFWPGLLTGLLLAATAGLALTLAFPPAPLQQPEIDPASLVAPAAPGAPETPAEPAPASPAGLLPEPYGSPLIEGAPRLEAAPATEAGAAGAASLVPQSTE
jgi:hypothetical protein